jgi:ATP-dependent Clp protease ATP-binding subunit ClpC
VHEENKKKTYAALEKIMRPELLNRLDSVVTFHSLTTKEVSKIFDILIDELQERLIHKGIHLVVTPSAKKYIMKIGYDEKFGARPLRRAIEDELEHAIADGVLSGAYEKGSVLTARAMHGTITIDVTNE